MSAGCVLNSYVLKMISTYDVISREFLPHDLLHQWIYVFNLHVIIFYWHLTKYFFNPSLNHFFFSFQVRFCASFLPHFYELTPDGHLNSGYQNEGFFTSLDWYSTTFIFQVRDDKSECDVIWEWFHRCHGVEWKK